VGNLPSHFPAGDQGAHLTDPVRISAIRRARRLSARLPLKWDRRLRELGKVAINYRGARSSGLRGILFRALGRYSPVLAARYGDGMILVAASDNEIGRAVFMRGEYERLYMAEALNYLRSLPGSPEPGPVFVDVGANIGISALDALLHFGFKEAVCFEPDSRNFRLLRMNLILNDLEDRVATHRVALSDSDGSGVIERAPGNFGDSRLVSGDEPATFEREVVATRTLDGLVADGALDLQRIGLVWIDTQGYDPYVLAGARSVLDAGIPVVVEYWPQGLASSGGLDLFEELVAANFSVVVDLRRRCEGAGDGGVMPSADVATLRERYVGGEFTDLLLIG
jgi:FkbM family methyltransferase